MLPDLPPKTVFELAPELLPIQRAAYDVAHHEGRVWLRSLGAELRMTHVLELILRLKQICNACPRTGASAKLDDLRRRLHEVTEGGEKALVFNQFASDPGRRVLVASLRAGDVGLDLTAASVAFHFDRWWNPAVETQAEYRPHRIGQTRPVQVVASLTPDSIEQRVGEILNEKRTLFADIIDGVATASLRRLDLPALLRAAEG